MKSAMMAKPADKNIQSGNSRVKVTIYGQVNRAIRYANTGDETEITSVDNDGSSSRIGIRAVGQANPNLTIGALHELEWQENRRSGTSEDTGATTRVRARHVDLWLDHKDIGQLWMGHGSIAGDAGGLMELTGVSFVYGFAGANGTDGTKADASVAMMNTSAATVRTMQATGKARGFRPFNFFGARENRIMYVTPSLMGARVRLSYGENKSWSAGLRYIGKPPGTKDFTVALFAGYRNNPNGHAEGVEKTAYAVSGGVKHSSGFNLNGSYDTDGEDSPMGAKHMQWGVSGGWSGKVNDAGGTSIGMGYNRSTDGMDGKSQQYWAAIVQKVDAAAADIYAGFSYDSGSVTHTVSAAEALEADRTGSGSDATGDLVLPLAAAPNPCTMTNDSDQMAKASEGSTCEVERKGVFNFVVGIRLKF
ncbi:MAG: hypothetical protein OXH59_15295 [Rhodospirillaceae bacterium]|nr:hypothetical protein [Rhodospirillaceae bacterium]